MTPAEWHEAVSAAYSNATGAAIQYGEAGPDSEAHALRQLLDAEADFKRIIRLAAVVFTEPEDGETAAGCVDGSDRS